LNVSICSALMPSWDGFLPIRVPLDARVYGLPAVPPKAEVTVDIVATFAASKAARSDALRWLPVP